MTHDTEALKSLLAKVEAATGPSRELDAEICQGLDIAPWTGWWRTQSTAFAQGSNLDRETPELTASIDAALALVERVLPGAEGELRWPDPRSPDQETACRLRTGPLSSVESSAATRPLAILGSLLSAALAQGDPHEA